MRVSLNIAITQMVNRTRVTTDHFDLDACPSDEMMGMAVKNTTKPVNMETITYLVVKIISIVFYSPSFELEIPLKF